MIRFGIRCVICCFLMILVSQRAAVHAADAVTIEQQPDKLAIKINGKDFTVFNYGSSLRKPYFWPVLSSDGALLTRPIDPNEKDHPHHKGVWFSVDEVNDIKFWVERGKIVTREITSTSGNPAKIQLTNEWLKNDKDPVLIERTTISIYPSRLITYDSTLSAPKGQLVRFDDTKEGFFGIRIAQSMREKEGGAVFNSEGKKTTQECWGQPAKWVDYSGKVDGKTYGVTIMDHPGNFRPSRYHVRDYGLFSISPFGEGAYQNDGKKAKPYILDDATPSLRLRYGLYIHDGAGAEGDLTATYQKFLQTTN